MKNLKVLFSFCLIVLGLTMNINQALADDFNIEKTSFKNQTITFTKTEFSDGIVVPLKEISFLTLPEQTIGEFFLSNVKVLANSPILYNELDNLTFVPTTDYIGSFTVNLSPKDTSEQTLTPMTLLISIVEPSTSEPPQETATPEPTPTPTPVPTNTPEPIYRDMHLHWAEYSANMLHNKNIWVGEKIGDKKYFYPEVTLNRIEYLFVTLSTLGIDYDTVENPQIKVFEDEDNLPAYIVSAAKKAYELGILKGVAQNGKVYIMPYDKLSRVEAAQIISNTIKTIATKASVTTLDFTDLNIIPEWSKDALTFLSAYNLIQGYEDGSFRPYNLVKRSEAAEIMIQVTKLSTASPELFNYSKKSILSQILK